MQNSQLPLNFIVRQDYRSEDFLQSKSNEMAFRALESWPNWTTYGLILCGENKVGKTHLAHIFCRKAKGLFLQKENLKNLDQFERFIQRGKPYILDEPGLLKEGDEQNLFHLCNLIKERGAFLLIIAEKSPSYWDVHLKDLESRLSVFPTIQIQKPEEELLEAILVKKVSELQIDLDASVSHYILTHTERSAGFLVTLLDKLNNESLIHQRKITVPFVKKFLE